MKNVLVAAASTAAIIAMTTGAMAQDEKSPWFVQMGIGSIGFNSSATLDARGARVPGASARAKDNLTLSVDVGYFVSDDISVTFSGGYPPKSEVTGTGTAAAFGKLGKVTYGPSALTAQYHLPNMGAWRPYVGAGVVYAIIFDNEDGAVQDLKVKSGFGSTVQLGANYAVNDNWGLYIDAKKMFLSLDATGNLGGGPVTAKIRLDPLVVSTGISYRF